MKPIEPGCLCIVTGGPVPENIGKTVTVIRWVEAGEPVPEVSMMLSCNHAGWVCESQGEPLLLYLVAFGTRGMFTSQHGAFLPKHLTRIDDGEQTDNTTTTKEKEKDYA